jgi:peptidoglycan/LPS O-acetylase OafA/YrhL
VQRLRHWRALDGMRAIAVLAVVGLHLGVLPGGYLGVDVFFVLSGFLITWLLIDEWDKRGGHIRFRNFYARRALRLFPALACVVVTASLLALILLATGIPVDLPLARATLGAGRWVAIFAGNFVLAQQPTTMSALGALGHTWSLAVEEQFYLLWPALFVLLMRRGTRRSRLAVALAVLAVAEMVYRLLGPQLGYSQNRIYYSTDTHSDGLLLGCALAFWLASRRPVPAVSSRLATAAMWLAASFLAVLFVIGPQSSAPVEIPIAVLSTAAIVVGIVLGRTPARLDRVLRSRWASYIGRRSYGLYLWHVVLLGAAAAIAAPTTGIYPPSGWPRLGFAVIIGIGTTASFVVADLSYRFIELPALRLKRRFSGAGNDAASVALAGVAPPVTQPPRT